MDENGEEIEGTKSGRGDGPPNCAGKHLCGDEKCGGSGGGGYRGPNSEEETDQPTMGK